ncbi:PTS-dependent dihydroxyacetone kinase phosphotransferase subunit DhaM [Halobacillus litoralis]|uniref:dihydroxyacetone kinase phosphoryl donor subunit DhaM n=1 Tax=Halobacillus litoralis TaxID=45668 RepID=UPI001CD7B013|nr:dihydroxyacetone kinase phosphoryl donor subunit DhaM [Halobacillus litoralis]MCA0971435.1 PTS-dependent dihydroxyacetone kinase phosphotransferase subunit DhaM [Halobacillus litoralis]
MPGIILVSHSQKVAEGIKELLEQVVGDVTIEAAGGDDDGGIGTSFEKIQTAVEKASAEDGAIIFYDIGSAKMNAEMAIEMAGSENVRLVEAPILEGAYLAAVEVSVGKSLENVMESVEKQYG